MKDNKPLSKEEILRKRVCKDCIWEEMQHLVNTPMEQVYKAMDEYAKQEAIGFAKWLKHLDNGDTHYNPETKEKTASIGFSPFDCFIDDIETPENLYALYLQQKQQP